MTRGTRLKNLKIRKVDFVDQGANPDADIMLAKRRDEEGDSEQGWLEKVVKALAAVLGIQEPDGIAKLAATFDEARAKVDVRRIFDTVWWDYQNALRESIESITVDATKSEDEKMQMIKQTLDQFTSAMLAALTDKTVQKSLETEIMTEEAKLDRIERMEKMRDELDEAIEKAMSEDEPEEDPEDDPEEPEGDDDADPENQEGDEEHMNLDKSKMTPGELMIYEELEKKYGGPAAEPKAEPATPHAAPPAADDVNKGLHPDVAAELAELKKFREDSELKEMTTIAKKYEIIGKKADELAPKLIELKKSGHYETFVSILDEQVALAEKSGMFKEIGKRGGNGGDELGVEAKIEKRAKEIQTAENISYFEAKDKAWAENPDLVNEYEKTRR